MTIESETHRPRRAALLTCATLCALGGMGAAPTDEIDRAYVMERVTEAIRAEFTSGMSSSVFRRVEGPHADLCRVEARRKSGQVHSTTWVDFGPRRWASTSRRKEFGSPAYWMTYAIAFDTRGRPTRYIQQRDDGRAPGSVRTTQRLAWYDDGALLMRRWIASGLYEEYVLDDERGDLVHVFRSWNDDPLEADHTIEVGRDSIRYHLPQLPDAYVKLTWNADGSIDYVSSRDQSEAIHTHYDPTGVLSKTPPWLIERDDEGRPTVADSGGIHDQHLFYGCDWPKDAPSPASLWPGRARPTATR